MFQSGRELAGLLNILGAIVALVMLGGLFIVHPNEAKALVLFGTYKGTVRKDGFWWANPFLTKQSISLRVRNFETAKLKVNDNHSNPIEIAAIVVWKVVDSAEALFEVDDYARYVEVQSESALRGVAVNYAYDSHTPGELSLSQNTDEVSAALEKALVDRLMKAGVQVVEARISHLAYSPEIAAAMLQRQQASAIISARQKIVEGAVGMVEMALGMLNEKQIVTLDNERKAAMVSNLLVVLCSDHATQPVVNTGSLYT
ncbi:MAG: SPFH domain-containing protein [Gemmatimonadaceae bacterium]|nr:SPFH domain-containing protein [Gemmatimonadaceae bacterium]MCW5826560.1 SPFH domain-containing protein [Gemmatimonadaceae bacterium]